LLTAPKVFLVWFLLETAAFLTMMASLRIVENAVVGPERSHEESSQRVRDYMMSAVWFGWSGTVCFYFVWSMNNSLPTNKSINLMLIVMMAYGVLASSVGGAAIGAYKRALSHRGRTE
jgi:hypothetical protein